MRQWINLIEGVFQPEIVDEKAIPILSPQQAADSKMFGPLYHGTRHSMDEIVQNGFDVNRSIPNNAKGDGGHTGEVGDNSGPSNGYNLQSYGYTGISAPIHHLGFGIYFTTKKAIAKAYAGGTAKNQRTFYLNSDRILKINFGAPNTMMNWWIKNGYNMTAEETTKRDFRAWVRATKNLTAKLMANYDAVHFLGKGYKGRLLDGDQVCVYRPDLISVVNPKLASGLELGSKVFHTQEIPTRYLKSNVFYVDDVKPEDQQGQQGLVGWKGIFRADYEGSSRFAIHLIPPPSMWGTIVDVRTGSNGEKLYEIRWQKGGTRFNYTNIELIPK